MISIDLPQRVNVDNKSLVNSSNSTKGVQEKRLRVHLAFLCALVNDSKDPVIVRWIPISFQLADVLTKEKRINWKFNQNCSEKRDLQCSIDRYI